jgi:hypothetical protein
VVYLGRRHIRTDRAVAPYWLYGCPELIRIFGCELQNRGQPPDRVAVGVSYAPFQLLNAVDTQPRSLGQRFLSQSRCMSVPTQQVSEAGCWVVRH